MNFNADPLTPREHTVRTALERAYSRGKRAQEEGRDTWPVTDREAVVVTTQVSRASHDVEEVPPPSADPEPVTVDPLDRIADALEVLAGYYEPAYMQAVINARKKV